MWRKAELGVCVCVCDVSRSLRGGVAFPIQTRPRCRHRMRACEAGGCLGLKGMAKSKD
jgi:hypothetical protein